MGLSWEAEKAQAESMQRESDRRSADYRARKVTEATQEAVRQGVALGVRDVLGNLELTPAQLAKLRSNCWRCLL